MCVWSVVESVGSKLVGCFEGACKIIQTKKSILYLFHVFLIGQYIVNQLPENIKILEYNLNTIRCHRAASSSSSLLSSRITLRALPTAPKHKGEAPQHPTTVSKSW